MPDSTPNSPCAAPNTQPPGRPKLPFQSPGNYLPAPHQVRVGEAAFDQDRATPLVVPAGLTPGLAAGAMPQLAPMDTGMALGASDGQMLEDFETLVLHSTGQLQPRGQGFMPAPWQQSLEATLAGCSLDEAGQPSTGMQD